MEVLAAFGAMVVATQELEVWTGACIAFCLDSPGDVDAISASLDFRKKIDTLGALVHNRTAGDSENRSAWDAFERRLHGARDARNHFVHSSFEPDFSDDIYIGELVALKRRPRKEPAIKPAHKDELYRLAREAELLLDELVTFILQLTEPDTSADESQ